MEVDNNTKQLQHYLKVGTEYIKKALSIDEKTSMKEEAINYYKLGIEEFILGLGIQLVGEDKERWAHLQEKMEGNLTMALERVEVLNHSSPRLDSIKRKLENTKQERNSRLGGVGTRASAAAGTTTITRRPIASNPTTIVPQKPNTKPTTRPQSSSSIPNNTTNTSNNARKNQLSARAKEPADSNNNNRRNGATTASTPDLSAKLPLKDLLKLPNVDKKMVEIILDEIVDQKNVKFSDIVGQNKAKQALSECVILPAINPELFTGLLQPLKGLLLFGPPGNGKTMLAKAAANEANCNFFNINSSSLTSKYVGEGEKLVRTLFAVARHLQPSIIFIDEIDSILSERKDNEHEASRRLKTEFFSQFDGMQSDKKDRILVMGATNRPSDLDTAALRRFPKRIYVGVPDFETRAQLICKLLQSQPNSLTSEQIRQLAMRTEGYSGSDLNSLATEAAYGPIREKSLEDLRYCTKQAIRPISYNDFVQSLSQIKVTPPRALEELQEWNRMYGANN